MDNITMQMFGELRFSCLKHVETLIFPLTVQSCVFMTAGQLESLGLPQIRISGAWFWH